MTGIEWFRTLVKSDSLKGYLDLKMTVGRAHEVLSDFDKQVALAEARGYKNGLEAGR